MVSSRAPLASTLERMTSPFRLHQYSGRENGLMVIAPTSELRRLAGEINSQLIEGSDAEDCDWPRQVASIEIPGKNGGTPYTLSFHVETHSKKPPTNLPKSGSLFWIFAFLSVFSAIGIIWSVSWVARNAF